MFDLIFSNTICDLSILIQFMIIVVFHFFILFYFFEALMFQSKATLVLDNFIHKNLQGGIKASYIPVDVISLSCESK